MDGKEMYEKHDIEQRISRLKQTLQELRLKLHDNEESKRNLDDDSSDHTCHDFDDGNSFFPS